MAEFKMLHPFESFIRLGMVAADGEAMLTPPYHVQHSKRVSIPVTLKFYDLIELDDSLGDAIVFITKDGTRLFFPAFAQNSAMFLKLFESPDFIANRYARTGIRCVLFIGDVHGIIYGWNDTFSTHGELMRAFAGLSDKPYSTIGAPEKLNPLLSGAVAEVPSEKRTYVSIWGSDIKPVKAYIDVLLRKTNAVKPISLEVSQNDFAGPWDVVEWPV